MRNVKWGVQRPLTLASVVVAAWAIAAWGAGFAPTHAADAPAPGSIMALMVETAAPAAAAIWNDSYSENLKDEDWVRLKAAAATLVETAKIVRAGGTLPADRAKASSPAWTEWAQQFADLTATLRHATDAKEQKAVALAGDAMVEICGGCHTAFPATVP